MSRAKIIEKHKLSPDEILEVYSDFDVIVPSNKKKSSNIDAVFCERCNFLLKSKEDVQCHNTYSMCIACSNNIGSQENGSKCIKRNR